ncbi:hypothetical protein [Bremerella alba]|uniref:Uncharacterized protein n=1 Tax=Bremerella alba TaxID=980252 RepID=A0A7V9A5U5_9BACT|nr:hypothetical protein [Bremerella alba]MBA2113588.1 hypothetical protein [Bremerella alba]
MSYELDDELYDDPSRIPREVKQRFGVLPHFFQLGPETPEITENLWGFAKFGYLDNPLPSLLKERLFVYLSRFCRIRYCLARHVGFLVGLGRPSGNMKCPPETIDQVVQLIQRDLPCGEALEPHLNALRDKPTIFAKPPASGTPEEETLFACASHVFLRTPQASSCLKALNGAMGAEAFQHLLVFLAFVRTAHFWSEVHPELELEEDLKTLLKVHGKLAECIQCEPEAIETTPFVRCDI